MKKLVVLMAVAAGAVAVNAASLAWGAAVCSPDGVTEVGAGSVAYLIYSETAFSGLASTYDIVTGTTDNGGVMVQSHTITSSEAAGFAFENLFTRADADGGVNGYYQLLLVEASDPTKFAVANLGQVTGLSDTTSAGVLKYNINWDNYDDFLGNSGYIGSVTGGGSSPIPEPTSGLLLLLGAAGMALRRRRA